MVIVHIRAFQHLQVIHILYLLKYFPYIVEEGLLTKKDIEKENWGTNPRYVDYGQIYTSRFKVLEKAKKKGYKDALGELSYFKKNNPWVENYALFMALKKRFGQLSWQEWPEEDIRLHEKAAVEKYTKELSEDIELFEFIQYLFFKQWTKLKKYINDLGIETSNFIVMLMLRG